MKPQNICNKTCVYEQQPVKIDDFNEAEEKEVKEHVEKRKINRREVAEENKLVKKKKRKKKKKIKEN